MKRYSKIQIFKKYILESISLCHTYTMSWLRDFNQTKPKKGPNLIQGRNLNGFQ